MLWIRLLAMLAVATWGFSPVAAQEALALFESRPEGPLISPDEIKTLTRLVGLTADQAEVASTLQEGLEADLKTAKRQREQAEQAIQRDSEEHPQVDQSGPYEAAATRFRNRCGDIERAFLGDILGILTEEQSARWPDFERYRRRVHSRGWWQRPASDADLVKVVEGLGLEEGQAAPIRPLLEEYERELDPAVIARMAVKRDGIGIDYSADYEKRQSWYARAYDQTQQLDQRLAGLNRKYARLITPLLPAARQEEFQTRFGEASYINLYTPSDMRKRVDASEKLADLTDQQRTDIAAILVSFRRDVAVVEREAERLEDEQAYQYSYQQVSEGKGPKGYNERYNEIWALEGRALEAVRKVLSEEQIEKIDAAAGG